ncbi:hypothetical protein ACLQ21_15770, partial [Agrococcus sp. DT81.2]
FGFVMVTVCSPSNGDPPAYTDHLTPPFTDPVTGTVVAVDSRRQTVAQKLWLQARDGWCRCPGCPNPARRA